jgi:hypothetical protein
VPNTALEPPAHFEESMNALRLTASPEAAYSINQDLIKESLTAS